MKTRVVSVAYPTIPIMFVASVDEKRVPLHDTMGLAVTDLSNGTKSVTEITAVPGLRKVEFLLEGKPLDERRQKDVERTVAEFAQGRDLPGLRIESRNYNIYSGSSDSGAAALVVGLNEMFGTGFSKERLAQLGNQVSESAIRSVYGGMNAYIVSEGTPRGEQVASDESLKGLRIFAMGFDYPSRVSAQQIFDICRASPFWQGRLAMVPRWKEAIMGGLRSGDWHAVFREAERNCSNAHFMVEYDGTRCRRKEMMNAVIDIEEIRASGLPAYWTAGGGRVINAFSWGPQADEVLAELRRRGQKPVEYKVAPAASVVESAGQA